MSGNCHVRQAKAGSKAAHQDNWWRGLLLRAMLLDLGCRVCTEGRQGTAVRGRRGCQQLGLPPERRGAQYPNKTLASQGCKSHALQTWERCIGRPWPLGPSLFPLSLPRLAKAAQAPHLKTPDPRPLSAMCNPSHHVPAFPPTFQCASELIHVK